MAKLNDTRLGPARGTIGAFKPKPAALKGDQSQAQPPPKSRCQGCNGVAWGPHSGGRPVSPAPYSSPPLTRPQSRGGGHWGPSREQQRLLLLCPCQRTVRGVALGAPSLPSVEVRNQGRGFPGPSSSECMRDHCSCTRFSACGSQRNHTSCAGMRCPTRIGEILVLAFLSFHGLYV